MNFSQQNWSPEVRRISRRLRKGNKKAIAALRLTLEAEFCSEKEMQNKVIHCVNHYMNMINHPESTLRPVLAWSMIWIFSFAVLFSMNKNLVLDSFFYLLSAVLILKCFKAHWTLSVARDFYGVKQALNFYSKEEREKYLRELNGE